MSKEKLKELLTEQEWERVVDNADPETLNNPTYEPLAILSCAFRWADSPEGLEYWIAVHDRIRVACHESEQDTAIKAYTLKDVKNAFITGYFIAAPEVAAYEQYENITDPDSEDDNTELGELKEDSHANQSWLSYLKTI